MFLKFIPAIWKNSIGTDLSNDTVLVASYTISTDKTVLIDVTLLYFIRFTIRHGVGMFDALNKAASLYSV